MIAGPQSIELDSKTWSKGTYVYTVEAGGFTAQGKALVQ
jgi:hypothetical protein